MCDNYYYLKLITLKSIIKPFASDLCVQATNLIHHNFWQKIARSRDKNIRFFLAK